MPTRSEYILKACIFDLDGVIVDTAKYHYLAWKRMANELGFDFSKAQNEELKGISRMDSLRKILQWGNKELSNDEMNHYASQKNEWYLEFIDQMDQSEILPGVISFLQTLRAREIRIALGSASKNAMRILKNLDLIPYFEAVIDGTKVSRSKPDPEVFLLGSAALETPAESCVVFEDAQAGIEAAKAGGMAAIGVGNPEDLKGADHWIEGFAEFTVDDLQAVLAKL